MRGAPDSLLVRRARAGDRDAFALLYVRHQAAVASVCRARLRDPHLAEDATQEVFLRAWKALPNFTHDVNLVHWLRRIARNHCHDLWRAADRAAFMTSAAAVATEHEDLGAEAAVTGAVDRLAVQTLLRSLRPRDASLLVDHHDVGLSVATLADRWQMTRGAMEVALHRARQRARRCAEEQGLRGLIPLMGVRRIVAWFQRSAADLAGATSPAAAAALCNVAVVVAALVVAVPPAVGPNPAEAAPDRRSKPVAATASTPSHPSHPAVARATAQHAARPNADKAAARHVERPKAAAKQREPRPRQHARLVEVEPVAVPVAGGEFRTSPDDRWEQVRRYGVRNPATGGNLVSNTEYKHDPAPMRQVGGVACRTTEAAEPVTYCD